MLNVIARPDPRDWYAMPYDGRDYRDGLEGGVKGWRIAFSPTLGGARGRARDRKAGRRGRRAFRELGATVEEVDPEICPTAA